MRKTILLASFAFAVLVPAASGARQPSEACSTGEVPSSSTPLGVGVRQAGDPYQEPTTVYVCSTNAPAPGAVRARNDSSGTSVAVDGDDANTLAGCTDGYAAARVSTDGPHLYRSADGDYTAAAREKSPQDFAGGAAADCGESGSVNLLPDAATSVAGV